jgi:hypothetical protein
MPYGTEAFTDRYGDFKQPTIVDYDQADNEVAFNSISSADDIIQHNKDIELVYQEILAINPFHAGDRYLPFVQSFDGKLVWNIKKIDDMKTNSDWLFSFRKFLNKAKIEFSLKNKL